VPPVGTELAEPGATARPGWIRKLVETVQPLGSRADRLGATGVFAGLSWAELEIAATHFEEAKLERGFRLTVQGRPATTAWLILEGSALVSADARPLRVASRGDLLGLPSALGASPSPETAIALSPLVGFRAREEQLRKLMAHRAIRERLLVAGGVLAPAVRQASRRRSSPAS